MNCFWLLLVVVTLGTAADYNVCRPARASSDSGQDCGCARPTRYELADCRIGESQISSNDSVVADCGGLCYNNASNFDDGSALYPAWGHPRYVYACVCRSCVSFAPDPMQPNCGEKAYTFPGDGYFICVVFDSELPRYATTNLSINVLAMWVIEPKVPIVPTNASFIASPKKFDLTAVTSADGAVVFLHMTSGAITFEYYACYQMAFRSDSERRFFFTSSVAIPPSGRCEPDSVLIGIIIGLAVVVVVLAGLVLFCCYRARHQCQNNVIVDGDGQPLFRTSDIYDIALHKKLEQNYGAICNYLNSHAPVNQRDFFEPERHHTILDVLNQAVRSALTVRLVAQSISSIGHANVAMELSRRYSASFFADNSATDDAVRAASPEVST